MAMHPRRLSLAHPIGYSIPLLETITDPFALSARSGCPKMHVLCSTTACRDCSLTPDMYTYCPRITARLGGSIAGVESFQFVLFGTWGETISH